MVFLENRRTKKNIQLMYILCIWMLETPFKNVFSPIYCTEKRTNWIVRNGAIKGMIVSCRSTLNHIRVSNQPFRTSWSISSFVSMQTPFKHIELSVILYRSHSIQHTTYCFGLVYIFNKRTFLISCNLF